MKNYKEIYEQSFSDSKYNLHPDTEFRFNMVYDYINTNNVNTLVDISSGRGNIIKHIITNHPNIEILSCDLKKFHDYDVEFIEIDLCDKNTFKITKKYDLLTCLDVLEHIGKECVDDILYFFSRISKHSLVTIANHSDIQNGIELHVIQENMEYWTPLIEKYFEIIKSETQYNNTLYMLTLKSKNNG
jgi:hypothetical protein